MRAATTSSSGMRLACMTSAAGFHELKSRVDAEVQRMNGMLQALTSVFIGLFTGPHQTSLLDESSSTMRLSEGERPVLAPEYAERAPDAVMAEPVS